MWGNYTSPKRQRGIPAESLADASGWCCGSLLLEAIEEAIQGDFKLFRRFVARLVKLAADACDQVGAEVNIVLMLDFTPPLAALASAGAFQTGRAVLKHA